MITLKKVLLGSALAAIAGLALAAPLEQARVDLAAALSGCAMQAADSLSVQPVALEIVSEPAQLAPASASGLEEYLDFHAQATSDKGKGSFMPWSGLRIQAN